MNTLKERIEYVLEANSWGIVDVAKAAGVSTSAVSQWLGRGNKTTHSIGDIEAAARLGAQTGLSPLWLAKGVGDMHATTSANALAIAGARHVSAWNDDSELPDGLMSIPVTRITFKGGNGKEFDYSLDEQEDAVVYKRSFFHKTKTNPSRCKRFKVTGDSMEGTLFDGDSVLVDMGEQAVIDGRVYAIRYGNELRVKRLYKKLDGSLTLKSDNANYGEETIPPDLVAEHITIIGRVIDRSGAGGL